VDTVKLLIYDMTVETNKQSAAPVS